MQRRGGRALTNVRVTEAIRHAGPEEIDPRNEWTNNDSAASDDDGADQHNVVQEDRERPARRTRARWKWATTRSAADHAGADILSIEANADGSLNRVLARRLVRATAKRRRSLNPSPSDVSRNLSGCLACDREMSIAPQGVVELPQRPELGTGHAPKRNPRTRSGTVVSGVAVTGTSRHGSPRRYRSCTCLDRCRPTQTSALGPTLCNR